MRLEEIAILRANLIYHRELAGYNKKEMSRSIKVHYNTYRNKEKSPLDFTLGELIELQKAVKAKTINEIFNIDEEGNVNAKKGGPRHTGSS